MRESSLQDVGHHPLVVLRAVESELRGGFLAFCTHSLQFGD